MSVAIIKAIDALAGTVIGAASLVGLAIAFAMRHRGAKAEERELLERLDAYRRAAEKDEG